MQLIFLVVAMMVSSVVASSGPMSSFYKRNLSRFYKRGGGAGCVDKFGSFHPPESYWDTGCAERCYCTRVDGGLYKTECGPYMCAIPVLKSVYSCIWVDNPNKNEQDNVNCCPVLRCDGGR